jgi:hypothetical protein
LVFWGASCCRSCFSKRWAFFFRSVFALGSIVHTCDTEKRRGSLSKIFLSFGKTMQRKPNVTHRTPGRDEASGWTYLGGASGEASDGSCAGWAMIPWKVGAHPSHLKWAGSPRWLLGF